LGWERRQRLRFGPGADHPGLSHECPVRRPFPGREPRRDYAACTYDLRSRHDHDRLTGGRHLFWFYSSKWNWRHACDEWGASYRIGGWRPLLHGWCVRQHIATCPYTKRDADQYVRLSIWNANHYHLGFFLPDVLPRLLSRAQPMPYKSGGREQHPRPLVAAHKHCCPSGPAAS
jgi:hypothetical protein